MTRKQALKLYTDVCIEVFGEHPLYSKAEEEDIYREMEEITTAKSDRIAGKTILWWGCWDKKITATAFARRIREVWKKESELEICGH